MDLSVSVCLACDSVDGWRSVLLRLALVRIDNGDTLNYRKSVGLILYCPKLGRSRVNLSPILDVSLDVSWLARSMSS